jgi:hypothetical protein
MAIAAKNASSAGAVLAESRLSACLISRPSWRRSRRSRRKVADKIAVANRQVREVQSLHPDLLEANKENGGHNLYEE